MDATTYFLNKSKYSAGEMNLQLKALSVKVRTYEVEEENLLLRVALWPPLAVKGTFG